MKIHQFLFSVLFLGLLGIACGSSPKVPAGNGDDAGVITGNDNTAADAGVDTDGDNQPTIGPERTYTVGTFDASIQDTTRNRAIAYRSYYPLESQGSVPVIIFSHGGDGNETGQLAAPHIGTELAKYGFLALHINHLPSVNNDQHRLDRPRDVSFVIDALQSATLTLPADFHGIPDLSRVGHSGHSWGAYTAHAVGGGIFDQGQFTDPRIKAIAPVSPQGPDQFGSFDRGESDNTWRTVVTPALTLLGSVEKDGPVNNPTKEVDWRLYPFNRYPNVPDRFLSIVPGQDHGDMVNPTGPAASFVAQNIRVFFQVFVEGRQEKVCDIGRISPLANTDSRRKFDPNTGLSKTCP